MSLRNEVNGVSGAYRRTGSDTGHSPNQLYIREGLPYGGKYVMWCQADGGGNRTHQGSLIGMGSYNSDSHNISCVAVPDGNVKNGDVQVPVQPYEIAYRTITPRRIESESLLVPVCLSLLMQCTLRVRMGPRGLLLSGRLWEWPLALAIQSRKPVQDISISVLHYKLGQQNAVLHLSEEFWSRCAEMSVSLLFRSKTIRMGEKIPTCTFFSACPWVSLSSGCTVFMQMV